MVLDDHGRFDTSSEWHLITARLTCVTGNPKEVSVDKPKGLGRSTESVG